MPDETPDVLIIGAGASGAVAAKRLVEEGFDVVCLEQGDWPDYTLARAAQPDYELTGARDWNWDPNLRAAPADYPVDDSDSDITALMWNGVGGGTVVYAAHWQRNMPSDFRVRTLDGVADDWPLDLRGPRALLRPGRTRLGGLRARRRHRLPGRGGAADAAGPHRRDGPPRRPGPQRARLALVARAERDRHPPVRPPQRLRPAGHLPAGLRRRGQGERRHHVLAGRDRARREAAHGCSREAPDRRLRRPRRGRPLRRLRRRRAGAARRGHDPLLQRRGHTPPAVPLGDRRAARRARELVRAGREAVDDASVRHRHGIVRGRPPLRIRAPGASTSTRSSSTRPIRSATSSAGRSGGCSRPAVPWR